MEKQKSKGKSSRRKFLQTGAIILGGTIVATYLGRGSLRRFAAETTEALDTPLLVSTYSPDFWFEVLTDNTILLKSPKVEMGQGIFTGLAMLAAEELEVSMNQIRVEHASSSKGPMDLTLTGGSSSTSSLYVPIREVAATMREMLKNAAGKHWNVQPGSISVKDGILTSGKNSMSFAEISALTKDWNIPDTPALKPASDFKYVGTNVKRIDLIPKVMGKPIFGIDHTFPDMVYAVILQSPYINGTIKSLDTKKAAESAGVIKVIEEKDLVAVVAKTRYAAEMALRLIEADWDIPRKWQQADFEEMVKVGNGNAVHMQADGNAESLIKENQGNAFRQEYRTPMAAHAQMEPNGTVAWVEKDSAKIVIGTQMPGMVARAVAKALDMDPEQVNLQVAYPGGGFGRRGMVNNAVHAAIISKLMGKPVHVFNTREQEFQNAVYRPNTHHVLEAKIGQGGVIEAIVHNQATPDTLVEAFAGSTALSLLGADFLSSGHGAGFIYNIKNKAAIVWQNKLPVRTGIWRSVGMYPNTFAVESFMNELAMKTGKDPFEMRIELLKGTEKVNERYVHVLETLREKSGWKFPKPPGTGRGLAICNDRKTIAAAVIEVQVIDKRIKIIKVTNVIDAGLSINPEGIRQQVEGCVMMGISSALYEELTVKDGQIAASNYHEYPLATLADTPEIEVIILQGSSEPLGVGEPPIEPIAPAIAAAVFDLTGQNLRSLPLRLS